MAGNEKHNQLLREAHPLAKDVECNGDGVWATITHDDGYEGQAKCPGCARERLARSAQAFIPPRFQAPIELVPEVSEWAQRGHNAQGLYLAGQVGTGKTHTAWHAAMAWCVATGTVPRAQEVDDWTGRHGPTVIFTRMTDLLDDLRPGDGARQRVRDCQHAQLLVLDDVGAEKASEWTQERLYSVIDHRYANCLPLIVTSNLPPGELAGQTGARTESRLAEMCRVVAITGTDRRKPAA